MMQNFNAFKMVYYLGTDTDLFTEAQPKAGTGHKMQTVSVIFSTLHCQGYITDLRYIAGSLGPCKFHIVALVYFRIRFFKEN